MFNKTGIKKTTGAAPVQILFDVQNQVSVSIVVDDGYSVTRDGRKIVPAGTPLSGSLTARNTAFVKAVDNTAESGASNGKPATGVLLHDVDVTDGDTNGTLLIWGFVDLNKIDTTTAALLTATRQGEMPSIKFLK
nr:MAG TPA: Head decoration protein [Bacteriophage sp.]